MLANTMRVYRSLSKIWAAAVTMASEIEAVQYTLANTMFVSTPNIETDVTSANGLHRTGAVP